MGGLDNSTVTLIQNSATQDRSGFRTSSYADDAVVAGMSYSIETVFNVETAKTFDLVFDPRALVASNKRFTVYPTKWSVDQEYLEITLGTCSAYDTGTALTLQNRNYYYSTSIPAETLVSYGVDRTITDYSASNTVIPVGIASTNQFAGGGIAMAGNISILDPSLIYVFRTSNATGNTIRLGFFVEVFETAESSRLEF